MWASSFLVPTMTERPCSLLAAEEERTAIGPDSQRQCATSVNVRHPIRSRGVVDAGSLTHRARTLR